ncbi:WhiB family transcriptional regulator [Streptomyces achromogenes]|uniref:WhiB family transcriptional regulator n=1 Tax=Streptomyces achromogenes TaxID=67255 RepID=UPI0036FC955E
MTYIDPELAAERARHWRDEAACREVDPDMFFTDNTHIVQQARKVCLGCPVRQQCTDYALEHGEWWGVWGGMTQTQLRTRSHRKDARYAA